jgi:hypothetical protein
MKMSKQALLAATVVFISATPAIAQSTTSTDTTMTRDSGDRDDDDSGKWGLLGLFGLAGLLGLSVVTITTIIARRTRVVLRTATSFNNRAHRLIRSGAPVA